MNRRQLIASAVALAVAGGFPSCAAQSATPKPEVLPVWDSPEFYDRLGSSLQADMNDGTMTGLHFLYRYPLKEGKWKMQAHGGLVMVRIDVFDRQPTDRPKLYKSVVCFASREEHFVTWDFDEIWYAPAGVMRSKFKTVEA